MVLRTEQGLSAWQVRILANA